MALIDSALSVLMYFHILDLVIELAENMGQLGKIRDKITESFQNINPDSVIVFGDVTSTLSSTLAARKLGVSLAHVESGLRRSDWSMPEEINRIFTDTITT